MCNFFYWVRICNYIHYIVGVKLFIHSQTSTVQPLMFVKGSVISSYTSYWACDYMSMLGLKSIHIRVSNSPNMLAMSLLCPSNIYQIRPHKIPFTWHHSCINAQLYILPHIKQQNIDEIWWGNDMRHSEKMKCVIWFLKNRLWNRTRLAKLQSTQHQRIVNTYRLGQKFLDTFFRRPNECVIWFENLS